MIRLATISDFDYIFGLYMHPAINPFLLYEQMTKAEFAPIFNDLIEQKLLYIFAQENTAVGMFKLVPLTYRTSHIAYLGGVAIHPDFGGKGFGKLMMQAIIDLGKQNGLKRIELSTATINEKAIRLYERVGFQKEGILRKYTYLKSEDRYLDEVMMSFLY
jgi:L-phenylalanine/L-methionine N-acetyltransferase